MKTNISILVAIIFCINAYSQTQSINITSFGKLFVSNYSPAQYGAGNQNWDICEGENGLIYIANGPLLEGGSDFWQNHFIKEETYIRSVHPMKGNRILVGANEEIGIFQRSDTPGETKYTSLMDKLDEKYHSFGSVWQIIDFNDVLYLRAGRGLFKYEADTIVPLLFGEIIDYIQFIEDQLFVLIAGKGLGIMVDNGFRLLPYGSFFADKRIKSLTTTDSGSGFLIFTDDNGIFKADMEKSEAFDAFNIREIIESQISSARFLDNKYFAIGTVKNGLFILDINGKIIQHLNKKTGLPNNTIICMYPDSSNNLWLGMDYGLSYVYLNSCLSIINSESDIGTGYVSKYFENKLYLGTNQGLYYMDWDKLNARRMGDMEIHPVKNISGQVWDLSISNGYLLCGHHKGLFRIKGDDAILISSMEGSWKIDSLYSLPGYYLQSAYRGYYLYKINNHGSFDLIHRMDDIEPSRMFAQDEQGYIWNVSTNNHLFRYTIDPQTLKISDKKQLTEKDGMDFEHIRIVGNKNQTFFSTEQGLYTFNNSTGMFENKQYFNDFLDLGDPLIEFFEDDYNRVWYATLNKMGYFSLHFGQMEKISWPFNIVSNSYTHVFGKINVIDNENVLFGVDRGFYHYNVNCNSRQVKTYKSYIVGLKTQSPPKKYSRARNGESHPVYSHNKNTFEFLFTSNIIESQEKVLFKFKLDGFDDEWSDWTTRNSKEYTNLFEGTYTLHLKAMDNSGTESSDSLFTFQVNPPNYRTIYAYIFYLFFIIIITILLRRYRKKKLEDEKQKIEFRKQKELDERNKKYEEEQFKARQKITELVNDKLHQDLKHKSIELSNSMINILHKNEIMLNLKNEMQGLYLEKNLQKRDFNIRKLIQVIDNEISTKKDLEVFDANFNAVHEEFIRNLKEKYPKLNQNDHRMCTFIKIEQINQGDSNLLKYVNKGC